MRYLWIALLAPLAAADDLARLSFFAGCWEAKAGGTSIQEQWTRPEGGTMLGLGRTIKDGKTVFSEFLRIEERKGRLVYIAHVGTQDATPFPLKSLTENEVVFENPSHDYPQRILYRKDGASLFARIEGSVKGKPRHEDYPYTRVRCEP